MSCPECMAEHIGHNAEDCDTCEQAALDWEHEQRMAALAAEAERHAAHWEYVDRVFFGGALTAEYGPLNDDSDKRLGKGH